ncbi:MAG: hypothetical protein BGP06_13750 [Rhizobiales bacterium 65-9]|nr:MAG: hypothetical protein BGP06_13750 [Rhizobiales bacterium 65-9]
MRHYLAHDLTPRETIMPSLMSFFPSDAGSALDYRELRMWLASLEAEVERLRAAIDSIGGQSPDTPFTVNGNAITMTTSGRASLTASVIQMSAGQTQFNTPMANFSGVIRCETIIATTVVGTSYTPGAGNIM